MNRRRHSALSTRRLESRRLFLEGLERRDLLATVVTDKPDYAPAETALITATGYQVGETVKFQVLHIDGTANTGNGHDPWNVQDGSAADLDGQVNGNISTSWYIDPDDSLGATFELSALGLSSGLFDTYVFTDAAPPSNGNLFQWDPTTNPDEEWVTGNNNGPYFEGDTVPYYTDFHNLVVGDVYQITIEWDTTKSGKHSLDYLRSYDATITFPPAIDPAVQAGVSVTSTDFFAIPEDTFMTSNPVFVANGGVQQPGTFKMYNGDMTAVSPYNNPPTYLGDTSTSITITFEALETDVVLTWGGHIGSRQDWGQFFSAIDIPGSPYHMRLDAFFDVTNNEDLGLGNTDRSLSADAVIFPATITVIKDAIPNDAQDFAFTTTGTGLSNFTLDDDSDNTLSNTQVFSVTNFDDKTITEALVAGWDLTNIQIVESGGLSDSTVNLGTRTANLEVQEGENITVTYTNEKRGSLTVVKDAIPNDAQDFTFDPSANLQAANFLLDDDANATLSNQQAFNNLAPGSYSVQEITIPAGWSLTNIVVTGAVASTVQIGADGDFDAGDSTVTIGLVNGENVTITYTNTKLGSLTVVKDAIPNDAQDFTFDPSANLQAANFLLDDDANATLSNSQAFNSLLPDNYSVQEISIPAGWSLTNIVVTGAVASTVQIGADGDFDAGDSTVTIGLVNGENVTITYTNTKLGSLTVVKDAIPNDAQNFTFDPSDGLQLANFLLDDDADPTLSNQQAFNNLAPGSYSVQEITIPAGWSLTNIVVSGAVASTVQIGADGDFDAGDSTVTIGLVNGENVTITYTNTKQATVLVVKNTIGGDATFEYDVSGALVGQGSPPVPDPLFITTSGGTGQSNLFTFTGLPAGGQSLIFDEILPSGWNFTSLQISGGDADDTFAGDIATLNVEPGETIVVTYTNTKKPSNIVIGPDKMNCSLPYIHVVNSETGELLTRFLAYEETYLGGVRVATGDLNGDGEAEIVTAPGRSHDPVVKIWKQDGTFLTQIQAFSSSFAGGVDIAIGDVNGDGLNDIAAAKNFLGNQVTVFRNTTAVVGGTPTFSTLGSFTPFGSFQGGTTIELADMGTATPPSTFDQSSLDGRAEVIVGTEAGTAPVVKVYSYFGAATTPSLVKTFNPFTPAFHGGMSLDVANINDDPGQDIPDIIVGAGNGGASEVQILDGKTGALIGGFTAFTPGDTSSYNAPIDVAALDETGDDIADVIFVAQGSDGAAEEIRKFDAQSGALISSLTEAQFDSTFQGQPIDDFCGAYFVAPLVNTPLSATSVEIASLGITVTFLPYGPTYFGGVSVATGDLNGDGIEEIVTAPERNYAPWIRIFDLAGNQLHQFLAYSSSFKGGVGVDLGDINGDGKLDIATSMLSGGNEVKVFRNKVVTGAKILPTTSSPQFSQYGKTLKPFGDTFKGGAVVELADLGTANSSTKKLESLNLDGAAKLDGKAELVVANGSGMRSTVKAYTYFGSNVTTSTAATLLRTYLPLDTVFKGGLSLDVGDVNGDHVPDIFVGAGKGGASQVQVLDGVTGAVQSSFQAFSSDEFNYNAKLEVEAHDTNLDGIVDLLLAAHDFDGKSREIRRFLPLTGELVDVFFQDYSKV